MNELIGFVEIYHSSYWFLAFTMLLNSYELNLVCQYFGFNSGTIVYKPTSIYSYDFRHVYIAELTCNKKLDSIEKCQYQIRNFTEIKKV